MPLNLKSEFLAKAPLGDGQSQEKAEAPRRSVSDEADCLILVAPSIELHCPVCGCLRDRLLVHHSIARCDKCWVASDGRVGVPTWPKGGYSVGLPKGLRRS